MIRELSIRNFQSHKRSVLKFDKGVNVIVGASDSGKTSIIRALNWVAWNRPSGDGFRSNWGGDTKVKLSTDSHDIVRIKSASENKYILNDSEDSLEFKAFGQDVPDEVKTALNINEINIQRQLDEPYLLTQSPGKVAEHFNRLAGIDIIDQAIRNIQKEVRETEHSIKLRKELIEDSLKLLKKYNGLEQTESKLIELEKLDKLIKSKEKDISELGNLMLGLDNIEDQIKENKQLLKFDDKVNELLNILNLKRTTTEKLMALRKVVQTVKVINDKILKTNRIIDLSQKVDKLIKLRDDLALLKAQFKRFKQLLTNYTDLQIELKETNDKLLEKQNLFDVNMPPVCPLCGTKLK